MAIYSFNHMKQDLKPIHQFVNYYGNLQKQPDAFKMNSDQNIAFIAAGKDSLFIKLSKDGK